MGADDETRIRELLDRWVAAIRAKDVDGSLAGWAPDVVAFDLIAPLQYRGRDAVRRRLEDWFSSFEGPIGYELDHLAVATGDEAAFAHSLNHVEGTTTDGRTVDMWWRATVCLRKRDGEWLVAHAHSSVPFDMTSGQASVDLRP
jgi:uncharacterized protein (TIGR02246 family)